MSGSPILLCAAAAPAADEVRHTLESAGFAVRLHRIGNGDSVNPSHLGLVLVEGSQRSADALKLCQRVRHSQGEEFVPILYLTDDGSPNTRLASLESGADAYLLRPCNPAELVAQVNALLRIKERHDSLTARTAEVSRVNKRLQAAYQQIDLELDLARRLQESFLPQTLPELPQVRFAVKYKPCGRVGGDFYDVFRLDERHVGFYVADAMGHGVPASLLTIFVKKGVRAKEINGKEYRLVPPHEVLGRLNRDLVEQELSDKPFITMAYMLLNFQDGSLSFSRAGHPYPLHVPREGAPTLWQCEGSLLGVFDTQYRLQQHRLRAGDKLLLYTDGMDAACFDGQPLGVPSLLAAAERHRQLPVADLIEQLALDLFGHAEQTDDLTILGLEML